MKVLVALCYSKKLNTLAWKAKVLPLHNARVPKVGIRTGQVRQGSTPDDSTGMTGWHRSDALHWPRKTSAPKRKPVPIARACAYIPSSRGKTSVIAGMYVTSIRKVSMVKSQGQVARVTSVRPSPEIDDAT